MNYKNIILSALALSASCTSLMLAMEAPKKQIQGLQTMLINSLYKGCVTGSIQEVAISLKLGANVNHQDDNGFTPLYGACEGGNVDIITLLIAHNAQVDTKSNTGFTALHVACDKGHLNIVKLLIGHKANPNVKNNEGLTPLHYACRSGHFKVVEFMINHADINAETEDKVTPLYSACYEGHIDIAKHLLAQRANTAVPAASSSLLHLACSKGYHNLIEPLIKYGAHIECLDKNNLTPLHIAAMNGNYQAAKILISCGANVNTESCPRVNPLFLASQHGHMDIVKLLINAQANVNIRNAKETTALHVACQKNYVDIAKILLLHGADVNSANNTGTTPLYLVCLNGKEVLARLLLTNKPEPAKINMQIDSQATALHAACFNGNINTVKTLIEFGAHKEARTNQMLTPLYIACMMGHEKVVEFLAPMSNVNTTMPNSGSTPLHAACQEGHLGIVKILANYKADFNALLFGKLTPADIANDHNHKAIATFVTQQIQKEKLLAKSNNSQISTKKYSSSQNAIIESPIQIQEPKTLSHKDTIMMCNADFASIHDCERIIKGGYDNKIFIFKNQQNLNTIVENHLSGLTYSKHVEEKMKIVRDSFHSFTPLVEEKFGHWGCTLIKNFTTNASEKNHWSKQFNVTKNVINEYLFEIHITIPAQIRSFWYSDEKANAQGPLGAFHFVVLKKNLSDTSGLCVHRCFEKSNK